MLRVLLSIILIIHGFIHILGFIKAYGIINIPQFSTNISRQAGILWLGTAGLLLMAFVLFINKREWWWIIALTGVVFSQILIISVWSDAKYGTILNIILFLVAVLSFGNWQFERKYRFDVATELNRTENNKLSIINEDDLKSLPHPVQNYLRYVGVVNKPVVKNFEIVFHGKMREKGKDWFSFTSEQFNSIDSPTRLFFMKANMFGIKVPGYHAYKNAHATMDIRLFGFFPIVKKGGPIMSRAETVTVFNDMCIFAPSSLLSKNIQWQPVDETSVKAVFTNKDISISAILYFNEKHELINFVSDDRYDVGSMNRYRFSTPVSNYRNMNGYNLATYGEAVWHYPDGAFTYGKFNLHSITYNK